MGDSQVGTGLQGGGTMHSIQRAWTFQQCYSRHPQGVLLTQLRKDDGEGWLKNRSLKRLQAQGVTAHHDLPALVGIYDLLPHPFSEAWKLHGTAGATKVERGHMARGSALIGVEGGGLGPGGLTLY